MFADVDIFNFVSMCWNLWFSECPLKWHWNHKYSCVQHNWELRFPQQQIHPDIYYFTRTRRTRLVWILSSVVDKCLLNWISIGVSYGFLFIGFFFFNLSVFVCNFWKSNRAMSANTLVFSTRQKLGRNEVDNQIVKYS